MAGDRLPTPTRLDLETTKSPTEALLKPSIKSLEGQLALGVVVAGLVISVGTTLHEAFPGSPWANVVLALGTFLGALVKAWRTLERRSDLKEIALETDAATRIAELTRGGAPPLEEGSRPPSGP